MAPKTDGSVLTDMAVDNELGDVNNSEPPPVRETWANDMEFLMSCIALAIGLGNVWRFPFIALANGGGAFLIPYIIILLVVGQPVYYLELLVGQFCSRGSIKCYDMVPAMRGIGFGQAYGIAMVSTYYAAMIALTLRFFIASFASVLPWSECRTEWGDNCIAASAKGSSSSTPSGNISSSELYFYKEILHELSNIHDGIGIPDWRLVLCLAGSWLGVVLILWRGIKSSGKASYFLALFPYLIMVVLLGRAVTLPGASKGILYLVTPQWGELLNVKVWFAAITQVFYSLGIFLGVLVTYASHGRFRQNVYRIAGTITFVDTLTSLMSGIIIFGILGNLAHETGTDDIASVVKGGTGLAFVSYPDAIAKFKKLPQLFSACFFLMLFVIGIGCVVGLQVCLMSYVQDYFGRMNKLMLISCMASVEFLIGLIYVTPGGQYMVNLVDFYSFSLLIYVMAIAQLVTIGWIYGVRQICRDVEFMLNSKPNVYWRISWGIVTPVMMIGIFIYALVKWSPLEYNNQEYSVGMSALGWSLTAFGFLQLPIWMGYAIYRQKGASFKEKFQGAFRANHLWGPADPVLKLQYALFIEYRDQCEADRNGGVVSNIWNKMFGA